MHALPKLPILRIEHELKGGLMDYDIFKSLAYNFLCIHITIKVNIILLIIIVHIVEFFYINTTYFIPKS